MGTPSTGKDVSVEFSVNGITVGVIDVVERFAADEVLTMIETKPLGKQGRMMDQEFEGWRGSIEVPANSDDVQVARDAIAAARELRVPVVIVLTEKVHYRNGQTKSWAYRDLKLTFGHEVRRGEKLMQRINWETGQERISL